LEKDICNYKNADIKVVFFSEAITLTSDPESKSHINHQEVVDQNSPPMIAYES